MKISKKSIMRATGWTEQKYRKEYSKFASKVKNLNRLAGTNYDVKNELYYSLKEPENATIKFIQKMSSSRKNISKPMRAVAKEFVANRFSSLMRENEDIKAEFEKIGTKQPTKTGKMRKYTLAQFNSYAKKYLKKLEKARKNDPLVGSDVSLEELEKASQADGQIYDANEEEYRDIFE